MGITIVYIVAGLSSRFGGKIKQFAKVGPNGETLIEYSVNQAINEGVEKIVFVVGEKTEQGFKEMFGNNYKNIPVEYGFQRYDKELRDKPWGTADAMCCAKDLIDDWFIVCTGDDIYGKNTFKILINHIKENQECATIGCKLINGVPKTGSVNRGIFTLDKDFYVIDIVETFNIEKSKIQEMGLEFDTLCSPSIFALNPNELNLINSSCEKFKQEHSNDRKKECLLPVEISNLIKQNKLKLKLLIMPDLWFSVTNPEDEEVVRNKLKDLNS